MENWIDAKFEIPAKEDLYIVIVSGSYKNVKLYNALCLAYWTEFGWIVDGYEEMIDPDVSYWMFTPEFPKEIQKEIDEVKARLEDGGKVVR